MKTEAAKVTITGKRIEELRTWAEKKANDIELQGGIAQHPAILIRREADRQCYRDIELALTELAQRRQNDAEMK